MSYDSLLVTTALSRVCYEHHCVVAENVHTPPWKVFFYNTTPTPLEFSFPGVFWYPPPPGISKFLKGCFCSPTPCFIRKGFSLKHRCKCQVKPTTYLTSTGSHFIVYLIILNCKKTKNNSKIIDCSHKKKRNEHVGMSNSDGCLFYMKKKKNL